MFFDKDQINKILRICRHVFEIIWNTTSVPVRPWPV